MGKAAKELEKAYESIRQDSNRNTVLELYLHILKCSTSVDNSTMEEVWRNKTAIRNYKIQLDGRSAYDTFFTLRG